MSAPHQRLPTLAHHPSLPPHHPSLFLPSSFHRWRSFHRGGSVALYIALYALGFLASSGTNLTGFMSVFIYLCHMSIIITGLYFAMGTIGFASSFWFVYRIFKAVKAD